MVIVWEMRNSLKLNDQKKLHIKRCGTQLTKGTANKGHRKTAALNGFIGKQKEMKTQEIRNKKRKRQESQRNKKKIKLKVSNQ